MEIHRSRGADFVDDLLGNFDTKVDTTVSNDGLK